MAEQSESGRPIPTGKAGRRVVASTCVTLAGYMVGPDEDMSWVIAGFDRDMAQDIARDMSGECDVVPERLFAGARARQDFVLARIKPYANGVIGTTYGREAVAR